MSEKPSKDEALEALDFIVNVLKEHEKDLDRLVSELGTVAGQLGESGELNGKVKKIEDKVSGLQNDVVNLLNSISALPRGASVPKSLPVNEPVHTASMPMLSETRLVLNCKQWEDFVRLSMHAQLVSFCSQDSGKTLEVNAFRSNQVIAFVGDTPAFSDLLKTWLSKRLEVSEHSILEGEISLK